MTLDQNPDHTSPTEVGEVARCPFCGGPAKDPVTYNGAMETGCAGPHGRRLDRGTNA